MNPSGWVKGQGELEEALGALETSSGGIRRPGLPVLSRAGTGVTVATLSRQEEEGMLCLAHEGVTWAELGPGTLGHQRCDHVTAVVVRLTLSINLTGGDWDSPREII